MRDEIRERLGNWGRFVKENRTSLVARNSLWEMAPDNMCKATMPVDIDDAEIVEHAITSLAQPGSAVEWRRTAFVLKLVYSENSPRSVKIEHYCRKWKTTVGERQFRRRLREAERFLAKMLPPKVARNVRQSV